MKINKSMIDAKWYDYELDNEVKFLIRQMPLSIGMWAANSPEEFMAFTRRRFLYCVQDWSGLVDENDKEFPCTEENKEFVFDYVQEIPLWMTGKLASLADQIIYDEKKTLSSSPSGTTDHQDPVVTYV